MMPLSMPVEIRPHIVAAAQTPLYEIAVVLLSRPHKSVKSCRENEKG